MNISEEEAKELESNEILQTIYRKRMEFRRRRALDPNTVTVDYETFKTLLDNAELINQQPMRWNPDDAHVFGMRLNAVVNTKDTIIKVGYME